MRSKTQFLLTLSFKGLDHWITFATIQSSLICIYPQDKYSLFFFTIVLCGCWGRAVEVGHFVRFIRYSRPQTSCCFLQHSQKSRLLVSVDENGKFPCFSHAWEILQNDRSSLEVSRIWQKVRAIIFITKPLSLTFILPDKFSSPRISGYIALMHNRCQ